MNTNGRLSVNGICVNCDEEGFTLVSYQWELQMKNDTTGNWTLVLDLGSKAMTNISEKNLVLRHNSLVIGTNYSLICRVENEGELGNSQ